MGNIVAERFKKLREEKELTQASAAGKLGVARMTIVNYEQGKNVPETEVLKKASSLFNCSTDYLLGMSDHRNYFEYLDSKSTAESLINNLKELPTEYQSSLIRKLNDIITNVIFVDSHMNNNSFKEGSEIIFESISSIINTQKKIIELVSDNRDISVHEVLDVIINKDLDINTLNRTINYMWGLSLHTVIQDLEEAPLKSKLLSYLDLNGINEEDWNMFIAEATILDKRY